MPAVERHREHGAPLPFEHMRLFLVVGPDLGGAPALHYHNDLLVHVALGIERAGARNLDDIEAPFAFGAVELDEGAVATHPVPALERHILHALDADAAENWNPLRLHPVVIGRVGPFPGTVAGVFSPFRLVP